jgi:hypothetical protein
VVRGIYWKNSWLLVAGWGCCELRLVLVLVLVLVLETQTRVDRASLQAGTGIHPHSPGISASTAREGPMARRAN